MSHFIKALAIIAVLTQVHYSLVNGDSFSSSGQFQSSTASCNRFRSRIARNTVEEQILPATDDVDFELPKECPFSRENDILRLQELSKKELWRDQWRCTICSKMFKSEYYLDKHLENKHHAHVAPNATVCLADFCDFLWCDSIIRQMTTEDRLDPMPEELLGFDPRAAPVCKDHVMERKKLACQGVMQKCFAPDTEVGKYLNDVFDREFCQKLSCNHREIEAIRNALSSRFGTSLRFRRKYYVFAGFLLTTVVIFYILFWCLRSSTRSTNDLSRLRRSTSVTRTSSIRGGLRNIAMLSGLNGKQPVNDSGTDSGPDGPNSDPVIAWTGSSGDLQRLRRSFRSNSKSKHF